jgi:glyoxylate reductase
MFKPRIFVTRIISEEGVGMVRGAMDAEVWREELPPSHEVLLQNIASVDGLLCLLTDNIDITVATERGIPIGNTFGVLTDATADFS